jgi:hypothetical protein
VCLGQPLAPYAAGIPAVLHAVNIRNDILLGVLSSAPPVLTHTYSEVALDGRWLRVDSYVVDPALFAVVRTPSAVRKPPPDSQLPCLPARAMATLLQPHDI